LSKKSFCWPAFLHHYTLLNLGCKSWGVTDLPPLKESRPEIPKSGTGEV
jgi:hypothetical protein